MFNVGSSVKLVSLVAASLMLAEAQTQFVLQDGTPIRLRINRNVSSADARVGETVDFEVLDEVLVDGVPVIARGGAALATVTEAQSKRSMGRAGKLNVNIDYVRTVNGDRVPLRGVKEMKGGGSSGKMAGAMVATSIVFFPAAPLFLFMKGKDITIPKGHEVTVYVNGDSRLDRAKFGGGQIQLASASPAPTTSAPMVNGNGKALTNEDVMALRKAGLGEQVIVAKVRSSRGAYRLEATDLVSLKQAGVSDAVIAAMLEAPH